MTEHTYSSQVFNQIFFLGQKKKASFAKKYKVVKFEYGLRKL